MKRVSSLAAAGIALGLLLAQFAVAEPPDRPPPVDHPAFPSAAGSPHESHVLEASVIAAAGSSAGTAGLRLDGSVGQPTPVGRGSVADGELQAGFWYLFHRLQQPTGVTDTPPAVDRLLGARPNPFNPATEIAFELATEKRVLLVIHDLQGRRVRTVLDGVLESGVHGVPWNGRDDCGRRQPSGVYFVRFVAGDVSTVSKMLLLK